MKYFKEFIVFLISSLSLFCLISCKNNSYIPLEVRESLKQFKDQSSKFREIINYYKNKHDSLGLKACYFIIENISGLKSIKIDSGNNKFIIKKDIKNIKKSFIIQNINSAVRSDRNNLLNGSISFEDFCEFVLPYRFDYEIPKDWRTTIKKQFYLITDSLNKNKDINDTLLCKLFNSKLRQGFKYTSSGSPSQFENWKQLLDNKRGNCNYMCKLISYPLRAYGIPVTMDYTPCWGNVNGGGHMWNVLIHFNSPNTPFMGLESNPRNYNPLILIRNKDPQKSTFRRCGKIYRKIFSINKNSLAYITKGNVIIPPIFMSERIKDVTNEYLPTGNIIIPIKYPHLKHTKLKFLYLGVFNTGQWIPTAWAKIGTDGNADFVNMATNILYMPMIRIGNSFKPTGYPVYLDTNGRTISLVPDLKHLVQINVLYLQSKEMDQMSAINRIGWGNKGFSLTMKKIMNNEIRSKPQHGINYTLYYWKKGWKKISSQTATSSYLVFSDVPANGLYRVLSSNGQNKERCFTIKEGKQIWW